MANPMQGPGGPYQPPGQQKSGGTSVLKIVLIVFGVLALCCVCCAGIAYYGWGQATYFLKQEVAKKANASQVVKDNIGEISADDLSMNLIATGERTNESGDGNNYIVFDVNGPKKSGQLILVQPKNGGNKDSIGEIILEVDNKRLKLNEEVTAEEETPKEEPVDGEDAGE